MPPRETTSQIRFNNIVAGLNAAVTTLELVSDSMKTPFLGPISNTMRSLLTAVQARSCNYLPSPEFQPAIIIDC
jgi:hypothetical protein